MKARLLALVGLALLLWRRYARTRSTVKVRVPFRLRNATDAPVTGSEREQELDDELDATFPASDPPSMTQPPTLTRRKPRR